MSFPFIATVVSFYLVATFLGTQFYFFLPLFFVQNGHPFYCCPLTRAKLNWKGVSFRPPLRWSIQQSNLLKGKPTLNIFLVLKSEIVKVCANPLMCHAYTCGAFTPCDVESESCHIRRWWRVGIIKYAGARPEAKRKRKARDQFK